MIKGVIFDFNGTLFIDHDKHVLAWGKISREIRGRGITDAELLEHCNGVPNKKVVEYFYGGNCTEEEMNLYSLRKEEYYRQFCREDKPGFHLIDGAEMYFDTLKKKKIPFTIASASIKENIDFFVSFFRLDRWIRPESIVYDDGTYENKIAMYLKAAAMVGQHIEDCLVFEDSISGIASAYEAGCRNIIAVDTAGNREKLQSMNGVVKVIRTFREIQG